MSPLFIRGGQGRTVDDVTASASAVTWILAVGVVLAAVLAAWGAS